MQIARDKKIKYFFPAVKPTSHSDKTSKMSSKVQ